MKRFLIIIFTLILVIGGSAGGAVYYWGWDKIEHVIGGKEPHSIAKRFWKATLKGNTETASWYMKPHEGLEPMLASVGDGDEVRLGGTHRQDGYYFVDTTLYLQRSNGRRVVRLKTVVVPDEDGNWQVDFWSSQQTTFDVGLEDGLSRMVALLSNASLEFPHLVSAGGDNEKEALAAAGEQVDVALTEAKEKIMQVYSKQLQKLKAQNEASRKQASVESPEGV